jgi:hypothetical protein
MNAWRRNRIAEQHYEIRLEVGLLAALDLRQTNFHRLLVEAGLVAHAPLEIESLEPCPVLLTQLRQLWKDVSLDRVPFFLQVFKRKTRKVRVAVGTLTPDDAQTGLRHYTRQRDDGVAIVSLHFVRQLAPPLDAFICCSTTCMKAWKPMPKLFGRV